MIKEFRFWSLFPALLLLSYVSVVAQDKPLADDKQRTILEAKQSSALSEGTFKLLWSRLNVDSRKVVTGAPYSAIAVSEHTQTLSDGNQIIRKSKATYYRDSEGRIRTERKLENVGNWTAAGGAPELIMIADPVAGRCYTLDPSNHTGRVDAYPAFPEAAKKAAIARPAKLPVKAAPAKSAVEAGKPAKAMPKLESPATESPLFNDSRRDRTKKEPLGRELIEGIEAEGTRTTQTIPAGEIGNTRQIEIVDESWYSTELQLQIMIVHRDPRSGESIFRLTNIDRSEPAKMLFKVPTGYELADSRESQKIYKRVVNDQQ